MFHEEMENVEKSLIKGWKLSLEDFGSAAIVLSLHGISLFKALGVRIVLWKPKTLSCLLCRFPSSSHVHKTAGA